jgi:uncharacterized membrane protein
MPQDFISQSANEAHELSLSRIDRGALWVTRKVGSVGFFLLVFAWTLGWCGWNILATQVPGLHLAAFDPFPAFVAYLLISNVIQILLMPLIMVAQSVDAKHDEIQTAKDHEATKHLVAQNEQLIAMVDSQYAAVSDLIKRLDKAEEPPTDSSPH